MCSLVDGAFPEPPSEDVVEDSKAKKLCQKCKEAEPILTLRKKDVYCKQCFLTNCNHKFRSTLGKNKAIRPNDRIMVAFSGSHGSLAVLKLIRNSLQDENNPKKVAYFPTIFIIDDGNDFQLEPVLNLAKKFNFPIFVSHISSMMSNDPSKGIFERQEYKRPEEQTSLEDFLSKTATDATAKLHLQKDLKRQLILSAAQFLNCSKVFTGESATVLAITLLSGVAIGRGAHVGNEAGFCDLRSDKVQVLRPLREFSVKEVALFNEHNDAEDAPIAHENEGTKKNLSDFSIERLTEKFVLELQEGFPSTVPTIFRTGDKLLLENHDVKCALCEGIVDILNSNGDNFCSALEAAKFSKLVSEKGPNGLPNSQLIPETIDKIIHIKPSGTESSEPQDCCSSGNGLCQDDGVSCKSKKASDRVDVTKALCYNCSRSLKDHENLPPFIKDSATKMVRQSQMKDEIKDFLL